MGEVIAEYDGTKQGTVHQIVRGGDGVVYCSCWAWKRNRKCKHLDRFFAGVTNKPTIPTPVPVMKTTGVMNTAKGVISAVEPSFWSVEEGKE